MKRGLGVLLAAILTAAPDAGAVEEGRSTLFDFHELQFEGRHHGRILTDVDADGLVDIVLVGTDAEERDRFELHICRQREGAGFRECSAYDLPVDVRAFDIAELDGAPGAELVLLTASGLRVASWSGGRFGQSASHPVRTLFDGTDPDEPEAYRFLWDLEDDGIAEMVLPTFEGPRIYGLRNGQAELLHSISSPARVRYTIGGSLQSDINAFLRSYARRAEASFSTPDVFIEDFDGDGRKDLITLEDMVLSLFRRNPDGSFPAEPSLVVKRSILDPSEKDHGPAGEGMTFSDLNGDGLADLIVNRWGTREERTRIDRWLYYARPGLKYPEEPDQRVRSESISVDFSIVDLDRNGKQDLVIPFFHVAPSQAIRVMTVNEVKFQARIFLMRDDGRYGQDEGKDFTKVDRRLVFNYRFDILGMIFESRAVPQGRLHPLVTLEGDYNGDGYPDLVADSGANRLSFHWGNAEADYSGSPDHVIPFESALDYDLADLNGDGRTDIVTYYQHGRLTEMEISARESQRRMSPGQRRREALRFAPRPAGAAVKVLLSKPQSPPL